MSSQSSWLKRRTTLEKSLLFFLILMVMVTTFIVLRFTAISNHSVSTDDTSTPQPETHVCTTADCVKTAARLLEAIDTTVDPCHDFYQYACGAWDRKHIIPDDKSSYGTFTKLRDEVTVALKALLEEEMMSSDSQATKMVKSAYQACLNMSAIEERGDTPLRELIAWLGGWPVLEAQWNEAEFDWIETVAKLRSLSSHVIISQWVSADDKNSDVNIIQLDQASLGMPSREYYLKGRDDKNLRAYEEFAVGVTKLLGATEEDASSQMADVIDLEIELANITLPHSERRDWEKMYHRFTIAELYSNITQDIDWLQYLNLVFNDVSMSVNMTEEVVLYTPEYMKQLAVVLKQTPNRTLANYMIWRIVKNRVSNLPQRFLELLQNYIKVLYGKATESARWRVCVGYTQGSFGMAVGRLFVEKHFNGEAKAIAEEMIQEVRLSFGELLNDLEWMGVETRAKAIEKANAMQEKIGYPEYILNDTLLMRDYEGISIDSTKYFENVLGYLNFITKMNLMRLRQPVDKTRWAMAPAVVNAMYSASKNQILFPVGILQPPFYSATYPKSMVFGGIGMVIGHEITHGFDDAGRQFDKDGNLQQWWSDSDIEKFKQRAQCIVEQYGNYTVEEINMNVNGKLTQGENIADNGGLKQAFKAYRNWVEHQGHEEAALPGIDLTHNQLFFLNFAQIWCGNSRPESYLQALLTDSHSPNMFRVIGPIQNSPDFARAFQCQIGSNMNPKKKCEVW